ncbi:hypothetical protein PENTCL1PPCAC_5140, partial [Pristionchus entomophagus]
EARDHSMWWAGPDRTTINHFQIVGRPDGKEQMVRVYFNEKLIDIVKDPATCHEAITSKQYNRLMDQNYCIWDCEPDFYAPLQIGADCTKEKDKDRLNS